MVARYSRVARRKRGESACETTRPPAMPPPATPQHANATLTLLHAIRTHHKVTSDGRRQSSQNSLLRNHTRHEALRPRHVSEGLRWASRSTNGAGPSMVAGPSAGASQSWPVCLNVLNFILSETEAMRSGSSPAPFFSVRSEPARSRALATSVLWKRHAMCSGVFPCLSR